MLKETGFVDIQVETKHRREAAALHVPSVWGLTEHEKNLQHMFWILLCRCRWNYLPGVNSKNWAPLCVCLDVACIKVDRTCRPPCLFLFTVKPRGTAREVVILWAVKENCVQTVWNRGWYVKFQLWSHNYVRPCLDMKHHFWVCSQISNLWTRIGAMGSLRLWWIGT
jgi:hypothetical protein